MKKETKIKSVLSIFVMLSCIGNIFASPKNSTNANPKPVSNFNVERYLGNWYEIGRFDFKWERNLKNVTANYSLNNDGTIKVVNSGFDYVAAKEKQSVGKAKFEGKDQNVGNLKVSFFGPFYSAYKIIGLDVDYNYALVAGENNKLLWILSRTKTIPDDVKENYIQLAQSAGYDFANFIWTVQE